MYSDVECYVDYISIGNEFGGTEVGHIPYPSDFCANGRHRTWAAAQPEPVPGSSSGVELCPSSPLPHYHHLHVISVYACKFIDNWRIEWLCWGANSFEHTVCRWGWNATEVKRVSHFSLIVGSFQNIVYLSFCWVTGRFFSYGEGSKVSVKRRYLPG